jgi:lysophospholipase L1-like esterase
MFRFLALLLLPLGVALAAAEPLKIVAFGDSITGDRPRKPYLHAYLKWSDLVQLGLEARGNQAQVLNRGFAGDTTHGSPSKDPPGAIHRLQDNVLDEKPAICVMLIGGNDFSKVKDQAPDSPAVGEVKKTLAANLTSMVGQMQAAGIKVLMVQYHTPTAKDQATAWKHLNWGNPVIAEVAKATGAATLELEPAFAAARAAGASNAELLNEQDGVHLSPRGELVIAKAVTARLVDLGWAR